MRLEELEQDENYRATSKAFLKALDLAGARTCGDDFPELVRAFTAVQSAFLPRIGDNEIAALEIRRRVAEMIFKAAVDTGQPFETCRNLWNELQRLGFSDIQRKCTMSWFYGECCLHNDEIEVGLDVLSPLIAEVEQLLADLTVTDAASQYYRHEVDNLAKLRDKLEAPRM